MKISLITTVLNEKGSITAFLDSINQQTKRPDEVIIVDGGSTDKTVSSIKYQVSSIKKIKFRLIVKKGNRSVGRNEAIKRSTGSIIVVSDAGCILNKNWLKNIVKPLEDNNIDVVAGYYKPIANTVFKMCLACYTCVMPDRIDKDNFLPSSRSIAFKRLAWEKVGGYPEDLNTCEDLVFDKKLERAGFKFVFSRNAIVYWPQRDNIDQAFRQFLSYAVGDGEALYIRPQTPFLFTRYIFGIILILLYFMTKSNLWLFAISYLLLAYFGWSIWKNYKYVRHPKAFLYLPLLQITSDIAVILGSTTGFIRSVAR